MAEKLKKSESLEIRIPYPTKQAFMARCQADGLSASEALRGFIERRLDERAARPRRRYAVAGALIAAAVGAIAAPSLAHQLRGADDSALHADFARIDADHDGRISFDEYRRASR